jgi:hypothetical protein
MNNLTNHEAHARDEAWALAHKHEPYRPAVRTMIMLDVTEWEATKRQLATALDELKQRTLERDAYKAGLEALTQ